MAEQEKKKKQASPLKNAATKKSRKIKTASYSSFQLRGRIKAAGPKLPSAPTILSRACKLLLRNWRPFLGIVIIYAVLNIVFAQGLAILTEMDNTSVDTAGATGGEQVVTGLALLSLLAGVTGDNPASAAYQLFIMLLVSLVIIWTLRQAYAGVKVRIRDAFYKGTFPLVPFILVLLVIGLQTIPFVVGNILYGLVAGTNLAAGNLEMALWALVFFVLALFTLYMLSSSLFALYIVCLPDMTPIKALRAASRLVQHRRWTVLRKILFLPLALLAGALVILLPLILWATPVAPFVFLAIGFVALPLVHAYMYTLYRELL